MAWEQRNNLQRYYYRKRRIGGRVYSEYIGSGPVAEMYAYLDRLEREEIHERRRERLRIVEQDHDIDEALDLSIALTRAALLLAGYHNHKGEWVRRRVRRIE